MGEKTVLVVGGAGYIGSHTCLELAARGFEPVVVDNLSNGHAEFVQWGPLEVADIRDRTRLREIIAKYEPVCALHFAALIEVGQSVKDPMAFYENNVSGTLSLLGALLEGGVDKFVFSSTCATYGLPLSLPLDESHPQAPINPYGRTKWVVEQALHDLDRHAGFRSVILRYFNAAGADFERRIGEWHTPETHAVPLAIQTAMGMREKFGVLGQDYDTRDGTCLRDYIHVLDLAAAHVQAVSYLLAGGVSEQFNLGSATGTTVKELLAAVEEVAGQPFPIEYVGRREGDSPALVANNDKARSILDWAPRYELREIIQSAWDWHQKHHNVLSLREGRRA